MISKSRFQSEYGRISGLLNRDKCSACNAILYHCTSPHSGEDYLACENQYGGKDFLLVGTGNCVDSLVCIKLFNEACDEYGYPRLNFR